MPFRAPYIPSQEGRSSTPINERLSFVTQLIDWLLAPLLFLWFASVGITNVIAIEVVQGPFDQRIADLATALSRLLNSGPDGQRFELPRAAEILLSADTKDDVYYAIRRDNGDVVAGTSDIPLPPVTIPSSEPFLHRGFLRGEEVRVATVRLAIGPGNYQEALLVQVAETTHKRRHLAGQIHSDVILPQLFVLIAAMALVWYGLRFVVTPLRALRRSIDFRDQNDLSPLDAGDAPREVQPLINSLNELLARLRSTLAAQRRFIADAAHQLRTPLAGLQSQTELTLRLAETTHPGDPEAARKVRRALEQLRRSSEQTVHLANRLLSLARAEAAPALVNRTAVDLNALAHEATGEWVPAAMEKDIDLGLEPSEANVAVDGDRVMLHEMLSNLVDNAIRYTPASGRVTVWVEATPPALAVEDTGPGIPADSYTAIFEPFFRVADNTQSGTGLGLAIVRGIAEAHRAKVTVQAGKGGVGSIFRVEFPAISAEPQEKFDD